MSCEHAFLALLDALEIQRSILGDASRGADVDTGPHRAAFEALERTAVTEANRLTVDASVPAVVRARARSFVIAATRTPTRSGLTSPAALRPTPTPITGTVVPRMTTPTAQIATSAVVPRMTTPAAQVATGAVLPRAASGTRPTTTPMPFPAPSLPMGAAVPPRFSPANAFPGLASAGVLSTEVPSSTSRLRVDDHLGALVAGWTCPHCALDIARTLHVSRVLGGRNAAVVDVVCANCSRRSPLPSAQWRAFDRLFGPFIGQSGAGFRPDAHGLQWDGT